mgnify:CR=1
MIDPKHWRVWLPPVIVLAITMLAPTIAGDQQLAACINPFLGDA